MGRSDWGRKTFTRFNRFRSERGHVFQGRYQALVVEDAAALFRVINYIHLNPVAAKLVEARAVADSRWSSLGRLSRGERPSRLVAEILLQQLGLEDKRSDWTRYLGYLTTLAGDPEEQRRQGFDKLTSGWAIGTIGWKRALAREYSHLKLDLGMSADGIRELKEARWCDAVDKALRECGHVETDLAVTPPSTPWKIAIAATLRRESAASFPWIARRLHLGNLNTFRSNVSRWQQLHSALA